MKILQQLKYMLLAAALAGCATPPPDDGRVIHVAPAPTGGEADGSRRHPFGSLEQARDFLRTLGPARTALTVVVHGGRYAVTNTFTLGAGDSGRPGNPIRWMAAPGETPVFSGGARLTAFRPAVRDAIPASVRGRVVQCDLADAGVSNLPPLVLGGFGSGRGFRTHPAPELFFNGVALPRAGWPDRGYAAVRAVNTNEQGTVSHGLRGSRQGIVYFDDERLARWAREPALWLHGYWFWDWADSYESVERIAPERGEIALAPPLHTYGFRAGQPFRAVNALCELDQPGEWFLDVAQNAVLFLPPSAPRRAVVELSLLRTPLVKLDGVADVMFDGLVWELGAGDGIVVENARNVTLSRCTVRRCGGNGVSVTGGASNTLSRCTVHGMGRGGLIIQGGDRRTLAPGGHRVDGCEVYDLSRVDRTYTPGVLVGGVGQVVTGSNIHDVPSSALRVGGNEHLIARNEIHHVVTESDDQGGVDMWGDPTFRGIVYRDNFFHDIGSTWNGGTEVKLGQAAIRLDDAISGVRIAGNRFERCGAGKTGFGAIQIHGGKDNLVESNVFIGCSAAVSFSSWPAERWSDFVAGRMEKGDIDAALYRARYPALNDLQTNANQNTVRDNHVTGGTLFRRPPPALRESGNMLATRAPPATPLFISGEGGYHTYRIPAAVSTVRGTLLAFCEGRKRSASDSGDIDLLLRRSTDGGKTWGPVATVWDDGSNTCGNPCPVVDRTTGAICLLSTWNHGDDHESRIIEGSSKDQRRVFLLVSTDDGATWSKPREITPDVKQTNWTWYATGPGAGIQVERGPHRGRLVIPCDHIEAGTRHYYSHVIYSDDHGQSWQRGGSSPGHQVNECEVVELDGGRLLLNMRNYDPAQRSRQVCVSDDGGATWKDQRHDPALLEPICQASIRRLRWPAAGRPGVVLFSNPADAGARRNLTVRASLDDAATWPRSLVLDPGGAAYSCLVALSNESFACLYEAAGYRRINFVPLRLDDLEP